MKKHTLAAHNITILFWASFFGSISFIQPVMTLFYMENGLTEAHILWVLMCWSGAVLVSEVPTGVFADRFGAKTSFITGASLRFVSIALLLFADSPCFFYASSILNGIAVTFFSGADEALIYESLKKSKEEHVMDRAMGKIESASFATMIVSVLIGAYVARDLQPKQFMLLIALGLVFQLAELALLFFIKNPQNAGSYRDNPFMQVREGMQAIQKKPQLLIIFLNVSLVFIPAGAVFDKFDQPLLKNAGAPVTMIGVIYALAALLGFFASRSIGWMTAKITKEKWMSITGYMAVIGLALAAAFGETLSLVLGALFMLRFVRAIRYPIYSQLSNDIIPSEVRATTISLLSILDSVLDLIIFGALSAIALYGPAYLYGACAIVALIGTLLPIRKIEVETK
ncbi:MAG: MFS transporter [Ectobacillus sp.]